MLRLLILIPALLGTATGSPGASPLILNEYNAVGKDKFLKGDARDSHFGRVEGNGGNWMELIVTRNQLDARGWRLVWKDKDSRGELTLSDAAVWSDLRAGTIITFIEKNTADGGLDSDLSFDPTNGDWWINVNTGDTALVSTGDSKFSVSNDAWSLTILDKSGQVVFGPAGEGATDWPGGGVGSDEIARLERDPSEDVRSSDSYDDGADSTFGAPNRWGKDDDFNAQDFTALRNGAQPSRPAADARNKHLRMRTLATIDVPGHTAEIVGYCASERVLVSTNGIWQTLDVFHVESLDPPVLEALDFDEEEPSKEGLWMGGEPTSVAIHPTLPIAIVVVLGNELPHRGRVRGIDLRRGKSMGTFLFDQEVGVHPDSVAISPDGRWAIIANEGQELFATPGSITAIDLRDLTLERRPWDGPLPSHELDGLSKALDTPLGDCEPEYVTFDPQSRFAVVSCQENDAVVLIDLASATPVIVGTIYLPYGSEPDGVSVLDDVPGPDGRIGCLLGIAEEGKFDRYGRELGGCVSFYWIDPDNLRGLPNLVCRLNVSRLLDPDGPIERRDPEGIVLKRLHDKPIAVVVTERGDRLIGLDLSKPASPIVFGVARVGDRPEGIVLVPHQDDLIAITGDEGNRGPGTISFTRIGY